MILLQNGALTTCILPTSVKNNTRRPLHHQERINPASMTSGLEYSFLDMAAEKDVAQMRALLAARQESPSEGTIQNALTTAAKMSHLEVIECILNRYPSVSLNEETVRGAVNTGSIPVLSALLTHDPSIINMQFDHRGTPLIVACMGRQNISYLTFLLEAGADPNQDPDAAAYPLALVAALYTDPEIINLLLSYGAKIEHSGAIAAAARRGNEEMLKRLLERGAKVEDDDTGVASGSSPLHIAVKAGHLGVVRILIQHGADTTLRDATGATVLDVIRRMRDDGKDVSQVAEVLGESLG